MPRVRLSRRAQVDFDEIIAYLSDIAGARVAARYGHEIRGSINRLAILPHIGPPRPALGTHIRIVIVSPYLIIYDPDSYDDGIHVLRILHESRDITRKTLMSR